MRRLCVALLGLGLTAATPALSAAATGRLRLTVSHLPRPRAGQLASLRVVRAADGTVAAVPAFARHRSVRLPAGVYVALATVTGGQRRPSYAGAEGGVVSPIRAAAVSIRLHAQVAGVASAAAASAVDFPVITAQGVTITGPGGAGIGLDGVLDGYLWDALHDSGVKVIDQTPEFVSAALREEELSAEGRLGAKFFFDPLAATHQVVGAGTIDRGGRASIELRMVDASGAIVAVAHAGGPARDLPDVLRRAVKELATQATPRLGPGAPPQSCTGPGRGCYGVSITAEGLFDQTGGWGAGTVYGPDGHGTVREGFDSVEHGSFGWWPAGQQVVITAAANRGSHFDHWTGSCTGDAVACRLTSGTGLDATALFAEDLWTLTVDNRNFSGGEAAGQAIGCGMRDHTCSRVLAGQTSDSDLFHLSISPESSHMISLLQGCDQFTGSFAAGGDCEIAATANKTVTVDFACNPHATSPCAGTSGAADVTGRGPR